MKKLILLLIAICSTIPSYGQYWPKNADAITLTPKDSLMIHLLTRINQKSAPAYELYETENLWVFLELETATGRIWQVQYSVDGQKNRIYVPLSMTILPEFSEEKDSYSGRYKLYKTKNMYNFILLDDATGATWQVQWSIEPRNRAILPINPGY